MPDLERPVDMGHIHDALEAPGRGVIPPPGPPPDETTGPPKRATKSKTTEGADEAPSVVEEGD